MARKQAQRPSWFKLWLRDKPLIAALPDEVAGKALKDALDYFETGEVPELDQLGSFAFALFKTGVDEANKDYQLSVESGRAGGQKAWAAVRKKSDTPPYTTPIPPLYPHYRGAYRRRSRSRSRSRRRECKGGQAARAPPFFSPFC